ncbi:MAG: NAD(P)H-hydrate dehydratase, partial [Dehalococcoidia bacterium]|nr:NAD(P)H-hydrate dehydratase [Dehalococcoidia bacterium]
MNEGAPILVVCGPGNNGGDGLVAARELVTWGASVAVYLTRSRGEDDAELAAVREAEIPVATAEDDPAFEELERWLAQAALIVDAVFGIGLRPGERSVEGVPREVLLRMETARERIAPPRVMAVDVPSGVDADTGAADEVAVRADQTVTFQCAKLGLFLGAGRALAGRVEVIDIGIPADAVRDLPVEELRLRDLRPGLPQRPDDSNKGTFGRAVIAGGSRRYPGAVRLAAEAAARSGCGIVTLAAPESVQPLLMGLPDPTHEPLPDSDGHLAAEGARTLLRALHTSTARALLVGPGLGLTDGTRAFVQHLLAGVDAVEGLDALVFDADALNVLAGEAEWWTRTPMPRVLTPHPGEMARLLGQSVAEVQARRLDVALEYAERTQSVVVLKGAGTVVAAPDGRARISDVANSALAHGGTGDVLAGLLVGLLAQGMTPFDAASAAVWVHTEAARQVSEVYGAPSTLASDLVKALPEARKLLEPPSARTSLDSAIMSRFEGGQSPI